MDGDNALPRCLQIVAAPRLAPIRERSPRSIKSGYCRDGAAQESNLPSPGQPDLTGFEDGQTGMRLATGAGFRPRSPPLTSGEIR
jgi:hypothetical protein